jgi:hypothetical protein
MLVYQGRPGRATPGQFSAPAWRLGVRRKTAERVLRQQNGDDGFIACRGAAAIDDTVDTAINFRSDAHACAAGLGARALNQNLAVLRVLKDQAVISC